MLVVGQTPPPLGGQAVMIEKMLDGDYGEIRLRHVRMAFSREMDEIGKAAPRKLLELIRVIVMIAFVRFRHGAKVLYYPPGGSSAAPLIRDTVILLATRWLFTSTIFHFHASGLGSRIEALPRPLRWLARRAYATPDVAIRLSELAPDDARRIGAEREFIIPNGVEDPFEGSSDTMPAERSEPPTILFVGVLCESKGVSVLLDACGQLREWGSAFRLNLVGRFESAEFERATRERIERLGLASVVELSGVRRGPEKFEAFTSASIFCLPTHFESETFSVVLVEAMSFGLPCVASTWRALPAIVEHGVTGFLVEVRDSADLSRRLKTLIDDHELREAMGRAGRRRYLESFTLAEYRRRLGRVFEVATRI